MHEEPTNARPSTDHPAFRNHPRRFRGSQWVYPVVSRRAGGFSVGVNLTPDKQCNFNCRYCQVDRTGPTKSPQAPLPLGELEEELRTTLELICAGDIYEFEPFNTTPAPLRRLNDIALSGDGEPTGSPQFLDVCRLCAAVKKQLSLDDVQIVLITNATLLHRPIVREALAVLDQNQGQIWAKLDAGTEGHFHFVNQTELPLHRVLDNLRDAARLRPIVIQSLFFCFDGERVSPEEIAAYARRLCDLLACGGQIAAVQLHTIARKPRDPRVSALTNDQLDQIAREISDIVSVPLQTFYGCPT